MGFMKFNNEKAAKVQVGFGLIDPGKYEMFVEKAEYRPSKKGSTPNINVTLVIRSDVDQQFQGRKLFNSFWLSEKSEEAKEYSMNMLLAFMHKIGTPDGMDFGTPQEVAAYMVANPVIGEVIIKPDQNGKDRNEFDHFEVSEFQGEKVAIVEKDKQEMKKAKEQITNKQTKVNDDPFDEANGGTVDISDDDLPF